MRRWHLSNSEKNEIRRLTRAGIRQSEIGRRLKIGRDTVGLWQKRLGLQTRPPLVPAPEKQIMRLLKRGMGLHPVARKLGIPMYRVWRTAKKNRWRRADGNGRADPAANESAFIEAVKNRDDHVVNLAAKYHIGLCRANRLAHEILQTVQFAPGPSKPALSSVFPQKHFGPRVR
jgi:transposase